METIIAKRVRNIGAYGIIKPLMRKKDNGDFIPVNSSQFPNSGDIFIPGGYGFLDDDLFEFESKFLQENDDYEQQLSDYQNKLNTKNPCKLVLLINPNRINKVLPTTLLPIYDNSFSLDEKKLFNSQNITAKYFF